MLEKKEEYSHEEQLKRILPLSLAQLFEPSKDPCAIIFDFIKTGQIHYLKIIDALHICNVFLDQHPNEYRELKDAISSAAQNNTLSALRSLWLRGYENKIFSATVLLANHELYRKVDKVCGGHFDQYLIVLLQKPSSRNPWPVTLPV